jgi:sulfur carrier protein
LIVLNGETSEVRPGETLAELLLDMGLDADARGIAVAVDGDVVPRASWGSFALKQDARVEVLTAMQGG